jgi:tripartite-type tricarboxylate transporter receptor subunit TctC
MNQMIRICSLTAVLCVAALSAAPSLAEPQRPEDFYRTKKEFYLITSSAVGGGYDQYSRLVARHMPKFLPGNPSIIVQNMIGGGGIRAANYIFNAAARDGTVFCLIDRGMPTAPLIYGEASKAQFNPLEFSWIGSLMTETGMGVIGARSVVKTIEDAKHHEIFFGTNGPETDPAMFVRLVNDLLGTKIKAVHGYKGQPDEFLSVGKGEIDGLFMSGWSGPGRAYVRERLARGEMRLLVQMAPRRDPLHADTPAILDLVSAPEDRQIVELVLNRMILGRPFIAPPGVPAARLALLREAFRRTTEDAEFRIDAEKQKLALNPTSGEAAEAIIRDIYRTPPRVVERTRKIAGLAAEP